LHAQERNGLGAATCIFRAKHVEKVVVVVVVAVGAKEEVGGDKKSDFL
jgi:hypothetical protein